VEYLSDGVSIFAALRRDKLEFCNYGAGIANITPGLQLHAPKLVQNQKHTLHQQSVCIYSRKYMVLSNRNYSRLQLEINVLNAL